MTEPPSEATVLDSSVLSNFAHVDRVELLLDLPRVTTVEIVRDELESGAETHRYLERALGVLETEIPVVTQSAMAVELEEQLVETLDPGEAQALAIAEITEGTIVTDDGDARSTAKRRGVATTGSIGLLVRFVESESLSAETADSCLKRWIDEAGFRAPARDFDVFLDG